jgi:hypothetical protein
MLHFWPLKKYHPSFYADHFVNMWLKNGIVEGVVAKNGGASATPQKRKIPILAVMLLFAQFKTQYR